MASASPAEAEGSVQAKLTYQNTAMERTLVANGKLFTRRDLAGSDGEIVGAMWEPTEVTVRNARMVPDVSLDVHGFELLVAPTSFTHDLFYDESKLWTEYFPEVTAYVQKATGASVVKAFDYNIRSAGGKKAGVGIQGSKTVVQGPAAVVHNDYTLTSGPRRLEQLAEPPKSNDVMSRMMGSDVALLSQEELARAKRGRYAVINLWRNIRDDPVQVFPLGCADARSSSNEDFCVFEIHYADRVGENYFAVHSPRHEWYYFPRMTREEAMLIKQWDSQGTFSGGTKSTFSLHTAFEDPTSPSDAPDRESIEVRCICIFDE